MKNSSRFLMMAVLLAGGLDLRAAEPAPYGSRDFYPSAERPIGFRGDGSTGHFPGAMPPASFSEKDGKNVLWSIKMPNWGQSSPIVVGEAVITMAEPDTTICVDADTGKVLWQDALGLLPKMTFDPASAKESGNYVHLWCGNGYSWPCSDGQRVIKVWIGGKGATAGALVCYDVATGKRLWLVRFSGDHQAHKFAHEGGRWAWKPDAAVQHADYAPAGHASPGLYGGTVIYHAKAKDRTHLVALDLRGRSWMAGGTCGT